jgi:polyphenol oxidase
MPKPLIADCLAGLPGIAHAFFTRHGGVSRGGYASLNCGLGSQDEPGAVHDNRARVAAFLTARDLITAHQVHSATAIVAEHAWSREERPHADDFFSYRRSRARKEADYGRQISAIVLT